jgi:RimJ/RimL family protein N-acetyltransferase
MEILETERLLLEPWHSERRSAWRLICADPEVMRYIGGGQTWTHAEADEVFDWALAHWGEHGFGWRSAVEKTTGNWLGFVGLNRPGPRAAAMKPEEVEIGWWLVRDRWGEGLASEGAVVLRDEAFGRLSLDRIIARVRPENTASVRITEKLGMTFEREAAGRHGERIAIYSLTRPKPPLATNVH